jgi:multiple sugar transport system permease protein
MSAVAGERSTAAAWVLKRLAPEGRFLTYKRQLFLLTLPYLVGLIGLVLVPFLFSIPFAFTRYDAISPPRWVGLENFQDMFSDDRFWAGVWSSLFFIALAVPLRMLGAMLLAFLLYKPRPSNRVYRVLVYLPTIVPEVAFAMLWLYIFNPLYGPLNWILPLFGLPPSVWLLWEWPARFAAVIMLLWTIGEGFVVMMAAMQDMPKELHDSASVDGATGWQRFNRITLPLIAPFLLLLTLRDIVLSFQITFVPALVTFGGGKPYYATQFLPFYIWQTVTDDGQFGYAAAMSWVMYAITAAIIVLTFVVARRIRGAYYE